MIGERGFALLLLLLGAFQLRGVLAARSAGCSRPAGMTSGTRTMTVNGRQRSYIVRVPNNYNPETAYKLIFGYHWLGGTMTDVATGQTVQRDVWSYYGLQRLAGESSIFVAPQGLNNGWANSGGEDLTFADQMIQTIESSLCVETSLRFATGFSYGGAMSYSLACSRATGAYAFRAVAVLSSPGVLSGCSGGTSPVAYLGIHGIRDNPAAGRNLRNTFLRNNGCADQNAPEPSQGSLTHIKTEYSCRAGYPVTWIAFDAGHIAAPHDGSTGDSGTQTFSPGETWSFFNQFSPSGGSQTSTTASSTTPTSTTPTSNPTPSASNCSPMWGQCGGQGWSGPTCCSQGTCRFSNQWYSQCL